MYRYLRKEKYSQGKTETTMAFNDEPQRRIFYLTTGNVFAATIKTRSKQQRVAKTHWDQKIRDSRENERKQGKAISMKNLGSSYNFRKQTCKTDRFDSTKLSHHGNVEVRLIFLYLV